MGGLGDTCGTSPCQTSCWRRCELLKHFGVQLLVLIGDEMVAKREPGRGRKFCFVGTEGVSDDLEV
jgi:hypothetical protein